MTKMTLDQVFDDMDQTFPENTPKQVNEMAFQWLSLNGRHAPDCARMVNRIMPQNPTSGLCKDYGGHYLTEEEREKIACSCGLDDLLRSLCHASTFND